MLRVRNDGVLSRLVEALGRLWSPRYKWSVQIFRNEYDLVYSMNANSVFELIDWLEIYFKDGTAPVEPWSLHLVFNPTSEMLNIGPEDFVPGQSLGCKDEILRIDPNAYTVRRQMPVLIDAETGNRVRMYTPSVLVNRGEPTFFHVMHEVFGRHQSEPSNKDHSEQDADANARHGPR